MSDSTFATPQQTVVDLQSSVEAYRQELAVREDRAKTIEVIEHQDNEFVVQNQDNGNQYVVRPQHPERNQRCECADCYHRSAKCKHQIAVETFLQRQQLERIIDMPSQNDHKDYGYDVKIEKNGQRCHFQWLRTKAQVLANLKMDFDSNEIANAVIIPLSQNAISRLEAEYEKDLDRF